MGGSPWVLDPARYLPDDKSQTRQQFIVLEKCLSANRGETVSRDSGGRRWQPYYASTCTTSATALLMSIQVEILSRVEAELIFFADNQAQQYIIIPRRHPTHRSALPVMAVPCHEAAAPPPLDHQCSPNSPLKRAPALPCLGMYRQIQWVYPVAWADSDGLSLCCFRYAASHAHHINEPSSSHSFSSLPAIHRVVLSTICISSLFILHLHLASSSLFEF